MNAYEERRFGRFEINNFLIKTHFELLQLLMGRVFVTDARHNLLGGVIEYTGISPLFDPLKEGEVIPKYNIEIYTGSDQIAEINFIKRGS